MSITKEQLPVNQFERLGIDKERLSKLPKDEMNNILSGYPSNMKFLNFKDSEGHTQKINARLSVYQTKDGTIGLKVHPYREKIKNDMDLTKKELERLKSGSTITKHHNGQDYLVQLDQSINELRRIKADHIKVAEAVGNSRLTPQQKTDLLSGKTVVLRDSKGRVTNISLDLSNPAGIRMEGPQKELKSQSIRGSGNQQMNDHRQQEHLRMKR